MESNTQQKQRYLRQEILESNYDPEEFINFLKSDLKIQQLDVDQLDMQTLESSVLKFKQYKYYHNDNKSTQSPQKVVEKNKKIEYEKYGSSSTYDYEFQETVKCVQVEAFSKQLEIYVSNIEVVQKEGIFFSLGSKTEIWYVVKTNLNKQSVKRLEEDFQWLSEMIIKLHPLLAIPELITVSKQDEGNYEKRRKELQQFIQIIGTREEMRRSSLFLQFLTLPPQKMQKMKKNYDSMSFVRNVNTIKNESGQLTIGLNNKLRNYVQSTSDYIRKIPKTHENISDSIAKIMQYLESTSKEIYKIVDYFAELHQFYNQITNKSPEYKINEYSQVLININNLFHTFANDLVNKSHTLKTNLKEFAKISLNYDKSINKFFKNLTQTEKDYISFKSSLNKKKERLYPDVSKWEVDQKLLENRRLKKQQAFELMLPKESSQQNQQRRWLAHLYNSYKTQFHAYLNFEVKRYGEVYCTFCSELLLNNKNYIEQLTKFIEESKRLVNM